MFVSQTTLEGLRVTIRSVVDLVDYIFKSFDEKEFSYLLNGFLEPRRSGGYLFCSRLSLLLYKIFLLILLAIIWAFPRNGWRTTSPNMQVDQRVIPTFLHVQSYRTSKGEQCG